jgi:phosphoribosylamine--glycine ligase
LIVGSGNAREHATFARLQRELGPNRVGFFLTGANGFLSRARNVLEVNAGDSLQDALEYFNPATVLLLSPNELLSNVAAEIGHMNVPCLAVSPEVAMLEDSKASAKEEMRRFGVPTPISHRIESIDEAITLIAERWVDDESEYVIKSDRMLLNASHRVAIPSNKQDALSVLSRWERLVGPVNSQNPLVVEEKVYGEELSFHVLVDPTHHRVMPYVRDYKRLHDEDRGPNTHGMGAVASTSASAWNKMRLVEEHVLSPTLALLRSVDPGASLILYIGVILTNSGPKVLEYNVRSGNPEWVALLELLTSPLHDILSALAARELGLVSPEYREDACSLVTMVNQKGYPEVEHFSSKEISGIDRLPPDVGLFSDGTNGVSGGRKFACSGRVFGISTHGENFTECRNRVYRALQQVGFHDMEYRTDIGLMND